MRIQAFGLPLPAEAHELVPIAVQGGAAQLQHRLRPWLDPTHARALHAILDVVSARPLDYPAGDRIALPQVLVITHPLAVLRQVATDRGQRLRLGPLPPAPPAHLP